MDDLKSHYILFKKLSEKAKETKSKVDCDNAVSMIDLIKSRYITNNSMIKQHELMFIEFTECLLWNYIVTRTNSDLNKFSKYCDYLEIYFPYNFVGCAYRLQLSLLKDGNNSAWEVNHLRKAYLKQLEVKPLRLNIYKSMSENVFNFAQTYEHLFPKVSRKLYEILANDAYQGEYDCSNLTDNEKEEYLAEIKEMYLISQAKAETM
jgi:hypothetical protein